MLCEQTVPLVATYPDFTMSLVTAESDGTLADTQVYNSQAKPVEDFFKEDGLLRNFEISGGIPETLPRLLQELGPFSYLLAERRAQAARNHLAKQMTWVSNQTQKVMSGTANGASKQAIPVQVTAQAMGKCTAAGSSESVAQQ